MTEYTDAEIEATRKKARQLTRDSMPRTTKQECMEAEAPAMYAFIQKIVDHANLQPRGQAFNMDDLHIIEIDQADGDEAKAILERIEMSEKPYYRFPDVVAKTYSKEYVARLKCERDELAECVNELYDALVNLESAARGMPNSHDDLCQGTLNLACEEARNIIAKVEK